MLRYEDATNFEKALLVHIECGILTMCPVSVWQINHTDKSRLQKSTKPNAL